MGGSAGPGVGKKGAGGKEVRKQKSSSTGHTLSRRQAWRIEKIQEEKRHRADKKLAQVTNGDGEADAASDLNQGLVVANYGASLMVEPLDAQGQALSETYRCAYRSNLGHIVTGDRVIWQKGIEAGTGVVDAVQPRANLLTRTTFSREEKPIAANIDQMVIVSAVAPGIHPTIIDRYLIAAEFFGIRPILVFNKSDLLESDTSDEDEQEAFAALREGIDDIAQMYQAIGYPVIYTRLDQRESLEPLIEQVQHQTSVFVGQSGVGKSSLINQLAPGLDIRTGALSGTSGLGCHTTTATTLYHWPHGGDLIDSPGIRELCLDHLDPQIILDGYTEFGPFLGHCKFRNCSHQKEPGCALQAALENGQIHPERFANYCRILASLDPT
jgi:ribosome biogenesis GTPase